MKAKDFLGQVPNLTGPVDYPALKTYLKHHQDINKNCGAEIKFNNIKIDVVDLKYGGGTGSKFGCYCPVNDRFYLIPTANQLNDPSTPWFYVDCKTGEVVPYYSNIEPIPILPDSYDSSTYLEYTGAVYAATLNRIYLVPCFTSVDLDVPGLTFWHYIDCVTGLVVAYEHGVDLNEFNIPSTVNIYGYMGGCYSPVQNRIYLMPTTQFTASQWHYIDCNDGRVVSYEPGLNLDELALYSRAYGEDDPNEHAQPWYWGGTYSPTQDRIYLTPFKQAENLTKLMLLPEVAHHAVKWHYIDCATNTLGSYDHNLPWTGHTPPEWSDPEEPPRGWGTLYMNAIFSPMQNRIYFLAITADGGGKTEGFHYIDCNTGELVLRKSEDRTVMNKLLFWGNPYAVYSPTSNRIYYSDVNHSLYVGNITDGTHGVYLDCDTDEYIFYELDDNYYGLPFHPALFFSPLNNRLYSIDWQGSHVKYLQESTTTCIPPQLIAHSIFK